jgi:UDP-glucose 4-epimerase
LRYDKNDYFNIGTGIETDVNKLFSRLNSLTGNQAQARYGPAKPGEQQRSVLNNQKAKLLLNWEPKVKLNEGLKATVEFFNSQKR